jgi:hypothetical protein
MSHDHYPLLLCDVTMLHGNGLICEHKENTALLLLAMCLLQALPSSGCTYHIAPSLKLFVLNSLLMCNRSFLSEVSACDVSPSLPLLCFSCSDYSLTAPTAPSLRQVILSSSFLGFQLIHVHPHHPAVFYFTCHGIA